MRSSPEAIAGRPKQFFNVVHDLRHITPQKSLVNIVNMEAHSLIVHCRNVDSSRNGTYAIVNCLAIIFEDL